MFIPNEMPYNDYWLENQIAWLQTSFYFFQTRIPVHEFVYFALLSIWVAKRP